MFFWFSVEKPSFAIEKIGMGPKNQKNIVKPKNQKLLSQPHSIDFVVIFGFVQSWCEYFLLNSSQQVYSGGFLNTFGDSVVGKPAGNHVIYAGNDWR